MGATARVDRGKPSWKRGGFAQAFDYIVSAAFPGAR